MFRGVDGRIGYGLGTFRGDLFGGITAAAIALPSALAYGVASGLGAAAGIYGAIASGFFAAVFGGTRGQISCPTAPTTVAMGVIVTIYADSLSEAFTIVILAGLLQVGLGLMGIGRYVIYTPYSVKSGFMSGIGVILIVLHIMPFLGLSNPEGEAMDVIGALPDAVRNINLSSISIALATLAVCLFWPAGWRRVLSPIPAALIMGTLLGALWLTDTPLIGDLPMGQLAVETHGILEGVVRSLQPALLLALIASLNTLLMSLVADSITRTTHNPNRELVGQGIGNVVAGLVGGVPGAGSGITVVNARVGGRTPVAGALCAVILLLALLGLGNIFQMVPHAALAGLMMKIGWDLIDWRFISRLARVQRAQLSVMLTTLGSTIVVDLLSAVAIGLILAGVVGARQLELLELDSVLSVPLLDASFFAPEETKDQEDPFSARVGLVAFKGIFTVASSNRMFTTLSVDIRDHEVVILDFTNTVYMDNSAAFMLEELIAVALQENTQCIVMGLDGSVESYLQSLQVLKLIPEDMFVTTISQARNTARQILKM